MSFEYYYTVSQKIYIFIQNKIYNKKYIYYNNVYLFWETIYYKNIQRDIIALAHLTIIIIIKLHYNNNYYYYLGGV